MPLHDWSRVDANLFHDFHQSWTVGIRNALNGGLLPKDKPLTLAAYVASIPKTAYIELVAVGDSLPAMPAYLDDDSYVPVPLKETYQATWRTCPEEMRALVEHAGS